ncbi:MAG: VWA domain-containing protein [Candidatus Hydrogenedentes bacterium]|nr:VWA domain-containing protein [Candidatus Hydrogenedentota bacterium]
MTPMTRTALRHLSRAILALLLLGAIAWGESVDVALEIANPILLKNQKATTYLRLSMTGKEPRDADHRAPVNVAFVIDKSGSMQGDKIVRAKEAIRMAIERLRNDDIVSFVAYDTNVRVLVPATKLTDKQPVYSAVAQLSADGSTALFAGVSKGAAELRKFLDKERVNRIVLLSDGIANVGPSSPGDLAELGTSLGREGIAVTTIGLGLDYNEDLMTKLAQSSDGNHMFAENAADLEQTFMREFGDVLTVVAQEVKATIHCEPGVRPVRMLGRQADIDGQDVTFTLNQLYGGQTKYAILEVEVPASNQDTQQGAVNGVASATFRCWDMESKSPREFTRTVSAVFVDSPDAVERSANADVMAAAVYQIGVERNIMAMRLRDEGKIDEAREVLQSNAYYLQENANRWGKDMLSEYSSSNVVAIENLDEALYKTQRKKMQEEQYEIVNQQKKQ